MTGEDLHPDNLIPRHRYRLKYTTVDKELTFIKDVRFLNLVRVPDDDGTAAVRLGIRFMQLDSQQTAILCWYRVVSAEELR